ncbi:hypothetical protein BCR32DRAFT_219042 [Anaeromyces robustus]|uniref:Cation/H+ exchanger transmembrane domain-containing protein n=1 Tax=Anaeromyces robustus TaxID=1754192 RepID=A0A1Y1XB33_9FUNG|nr:hypothetical protein BCR32DRAFT_219042 [Anaeromyces robustus]|eukprot:ORX82927.1 hypothetical protein BCR32DRAFT_219042 [Anaeromyces robustus]
MTSVIKIDFPENSVTVVLFLLTAFVICFSYISYYVKERLFLSEPLVATLVGILVGPKVLNWINPMAWTKEIHHLTFEISQAIILIQIITAVIQTPKNFFKHHWKGLATLWGPVSIYMWVVTALIFKFGLNIDYWPAFILSSCTTPTDPVLANSIVSGRFATLHIPINIRYVLSAESAGNDGVAYPLFLLAFLFHTQGDSSFFKNIFQWLGEVICYSVILAVVVGCGIGYITKYIFKFCLKKKLMDKPSFMAFLVCLALCTGAICDFFTISNYIAVFSAGVIISWDDFFAAESANTHAQEVLDMLMNWAFFIFFGSSINWEAFNSGYLVLWRLFLVTALIFVFRRLPAVLVFRNWITPIRFFKESVYVGWFGPVGVGAMWYTSLAIQRLHIEPFEEDNTENQLFNMYYYSIMFIVLCSIILHGITVPIAHMTLTYTTRSFHKKDNEVAWPKDMPIDGNAISGPITKLDSNVVLKKKDDEGGEITEQSDKVANITPVNNNENIQIDVNDHEDDFHARESEQQLMNDDEIKEINN